MTASKATVLSIEGKKLSQVDLPKQFSEKLDRALIKRAVLAIQSAKVQAKSPNPLAGRDNTATYIGARHKPQMHRTINVGHARKPRMKNRRGILSGQVAGIPGVVGGPKAHPPKTQKVTEEKINKKEKVKATASAIAATANLELVKDRGHLLPEGISMPIVLESKFEGIDKTKEVKAVLTKIDIWNDVEKAKSKKQIRPGKGKKRGRRYKKRKSILIVAENTEKVYKGARNIEGIEVVNTRELNANLLAPGTVPGRLTVWTEGALKALASERKQEKKIKITKEKSKEKK